MRDVLAPMMPAMAATELAALASVGQFLKSIAAPAHHDTIARLAVHLNARLAVHLDALEHDVTPEKK